MSEDFSGPALRIPNALRYLAASLLLLGSPVANANVAALSIELDRSTLVLKLSVSNPTQVERRIVRAGIKRTAISGGTQCLYTGLEPRLMSLADYTVNFHLKGHHEVTVRIDPARPIAPGDTASFTMGLSPNAGGVCGDWSFEANAFVVLDNGTRLDSDEVAVNSNHFKAALDRLPPQNQVFDLLKHHDPKLRIKGVQYLNEMDFDKPLLLSALNTALHDSDKGVRSNAYKKIGQLKLVELEPALREKLTRLPKPSTNDERYTYSSDAIGLADALAAIKSMASAEQILDLLEDPDFNMVILLRHPLKELRSPEMLEKIVARVKKNKRWASVSIYGGHDWSDREAGRFHVLMQALISYRDPSTLPLLQSIMDDPANRPGARTIMRLMFDQTDVKTPTDAPFVQGFAKYAENFVADKEEDQKTSLRGLSLILLSRMAVDRSEKISLLRSALNEVSARSYAANDAAVLQLKELAPELRALYESTTQEPLKYHYCRLLSQLGDACDMKLSPPKIPKKITWQEEVLIGPKETILVERIVHRVIVTIGWEKNGLPNQYVIRFKDPAASQEPIVWSSVKTGGSSGWDPEFPLVLGKERDGTWFIYTRIVVSAPCFRYSKYRFKEGKWSEVDLPLDIETLMPNLYLKANRKTSETMVSASQKTEEKDDPHDPHFHGRVGPKKYQCWGNYTGPYPPRERALP